MIGDSRLGQYRLGNRERHTIVAFCSLAVAGLVVLAVWSGRSGDSIKADRLLADVTDEEADGAEANVVSSEDGDVQDGDGSGGTLTIFSDGVSTTVRRTIPAAPSTARTTAVATTAPPTTEVPTTDTPVPPTEPPTTETTVPTTETTVVITIPDPTITKPTITLPDPTITFPTISLPDPTITFPTFPLPTISIPDDTVITRPRPRPLPPITEPVANQ